MRVRTSTPWASSSMSSLTGEIPFSGGTPYEVMSRRLHQDPRPAGTINPQIPTWLRSVLDRCLARNLPIAIRTWPRCSLDLDAKIRPTFPWRFRSSAVAG